MEEKFTQKWAIICLLEDIKEGTEFHHSNSPLHLTLAGVFAVDKKNGAQLAQELSELLQGQRPVKIKATKKDLFGSNHDIAVRRIQKTRDLTSLHQKIYDWLQVSGAIYNSPEYQGDGYAPHCTFQKSGSLDEGEVAILTSVSLIDLFPDGDGLQRKITKTVELH